MEYQDLVAVFIKRGFTRVERDDRLLDVYPKDTREKGIELWQCWDEACVDIVRMHFPYDPTKVTAYRLPREVVESDLLRSRVRESLLNADPVDLSEVLDKKCPGRDSNSQAITGNGF